MKTSFRSVVCAAILATLVPAQQLAVTVSPNPAPLGATITITAQATVPNLETPFGCLLYSVRAGSPTGPVVRLFGCTFLQGAIPVFGSATHRTATWNQSVNTPGGFATPGVYFLEIEREPVGGGVGITSEWFSVTISDPANPTPALTAVNAPLFGTTFDMALTAASAHAGEPYGVACSFTSNTGIPFTGGVASLDPDNLFFLSLTQDPTFFAGFSGALDQAGQSFQPIRIIFPPVTGVLCIPIHAQAVVFTPGGPLLSNDLTIPIH